MECGWNEREEEELSLALICTDSQQRGRGREEEGRGKSGRRRMVPRRTSELILRLIIDQRTAMTQGSLQPECQDALPFPHFMYIFKAPILKTHKTAVLTSNDFLQVAWKH